MLSKKYLARDKAAYIPKYPLSPKKAIKFILKAGGIPIAAHPYFIPYKNKEMWTSLKDDGIAGIEVWHTKHSPDTVARMLRIAFEFDFLTTGGSDCHGEYRDEPALMGKVKVPYSIVEKLKNAAEEK
jgi:predicted metal-dependent phosphoesterase TrpH